MSDPKETPEEDDEAVSYWQKRIKCLACGLHFIVCTDFREWPDKGTTRDQQLGEATGLIYCPECGSTDKPKLVYTKEVEGFIFQAVPGDATLTKMV